MIKCSPMRRERKWKAKLQPLFFELADLNKQGTVRRLQIEREYNQELKALGRSAAQPLKAEVVRRRKQKDEELMKWMDAKLVDLDERYKAVPESPRQYPWLQAARHGPLTPQKEEIGMLEWLHSERHGEALITTRAKADAGDLESLHKLQRTEEDAFRIKHGKALKKFQGDPIHRDIFQFGIGLGLENLSSEELADCFDEVCPCGAEGHNADALKKQRSRFLLEMQNTETDAGQKTRSPKGPAQNRKERLQIRAANRAGQRKQKPKQGE